MVHNNNCKFCEIGKKGLLYELPPDSKEKKPIPCKRGIYEDKYCIATLAPEQYTKGHTLVILKNHRIDITDSNLSKEELSGFINAIHKLARHLQENVRYNNKPPKRIYVICLCDGIEHLHIHLIPRYSYNNGEKQFYIDNYWDREKDSLNDNGKKKWKSKKDFIKAVKTESFKNKPFKIHGMWYAAYHEMKFKNIPFWQLPVDKRAKNLQELAKELRMTLI